MALPAQLPALKYIGFGVTEAGIASQTQVIKDLAEFLYHCSQTIPGALQPPREPMFVTHWS